MRERSAVVHVVRINAGPEECFARNALETLEVDAVAGEKLLVFAGEVVAHHADDLGFREIAGSQRDVGACASQHAIDFAMGSFHSVISHGTDDDDRHSFDCSIRARTSGAARCGLVRMKKRNRARSSVG